MSKDIYKTTKGNEVIVSKSNKVSGTCGTGSKKGTEKSNKILILKKSYDLQNSKIVTFLLKQGIHSVSLAKAHF